MRLPRRLAALLSFPALVSLAACGGGGGTGGAGDGSVTQVFSNDTFVNIVECGHASTYPWPIAVAGMPGTLTHVAVRLYGFTHTHPDDVDILLLSPSGGTVMLLSDAGGVTDVAGITLTFDDSGISAHQVLPLAETTYRPTDYGLPRTDAFVPGPLGPYAPAFSVLNGTDPNGTWRLFVVDGTCGDAGSILGWDLVLTTK